MKKNVGSVDRGVRIVLGLGIIGAGFYFQSPLGAIGLIPLATGFMSWCPAYVPFKMSTCSVKPNPKM